MKKIASTCCALATMFVMIPSLIHAGEASVTVAGNVVPAVASVTVPSTNVAFTIDLTKTPGTQLATTDFTVTNNMHSGLKLDIKSFAQQGEKKFNDVVPTKYADWTVLDKAKSADIAVGITPRESASWTGLTAGTRWVADNTNWELGVVNATSGVDFGVDVKYGPSIDEAKTVNYDLTFMFDFQ